MTRELWAVETQESDGTWTPTFSTNTKRKAEWIQQDTNTGIIHTQLMRYLPEAVLRDLITNGMGKHRNNIRYDDGWNDALAWLERQVQEKYRL